jgi:hypothetical protein
VTNLASAQEQKPSTEAPGAASDAIASSLLDDFTLTTSNLRLSAVMPFWKTARFSASDVIEARRLLRTCLQSLNLIESELDKRE